MGAHTGTQPGLMVTSSAGYGISREASKRKYHPYPESTCSHTNHECRDLVEQPLTVVVLTGVKGSGTQVVSVTLGAEFLARVKACPDGTRNFFDIPPYD
jgi:hypothetical protein